MFCGTRGEPIWSTPAGIESKGEESPISTKVILSNETTGETADLEDFDLQV